MDSWWQWYVLYIIYLYLHINKSDKRQSLCDYLFNYSNGITGVEDAEEPLTPVHRVSGVCSKLQCIYFYMYFQ